MHAARNQNVVIAYETSGPPGGEPLLLISGTGAQMLIWPEDFCAALAARGFHVARFDNRDTGLSTHLTGTPAPGWLHPMLRPSAAPYRLQHMADDALGGDGRPGLPDRARHGRVPGRDDRPGTGHPASRSGTARSPRSCLPPPPARHHAHHRGPCGRSRGQPVPRPPDPDQAAERAVALKKVIGSPGYPPDEPTVRDIARRSFQRHPGAEEDDLRQRAAVIASRDRRSTLAGLRVPALVIHGDHDPVIRPKGGRATAAAIPGARLISYPGMGHDLPRPLWPSILDEICILAERTKTPVTPPGSNQPQPAPNHPDDNGPAPEPGDLRAPCPDPPGLGAGWFDQVYAVGARVSQSRLAPERMTDSPVRSGYLWSIPFPPGTFPGSLSHS